MIGRVDDFELVDGVRAFELLVGGSDEDVVTRLGHFGNTVRAKETVVD